MKMNSKRKETNSFLVVDYSRRSVFFYYYYHVQDKCEKRIYILLVFKEKSFQSLFIFVFGMSLLPSHSDCTT